MKASEFAQATGAVLRGVPDDLEIAGLSTLDKAGPGEVSMLTSANWINRARDTKAAFVITSASLDADFQSKAPAVPVAVLPNPWSAIKWLLEALIPDRSFPWEGIHPTAVIHDTASVASGVTVGPCAVIGPDTAIGEGTRIGPGVVIGAECRIGKYCSLRPTVVLEAGTVLGDRVTVHAGSVIGADGFKYEVINGRREKIPQTGSVVIEDDVEIGANTCIDRASLTETRIGPNTKVDNLVQIGHNVTTGPDCVIVSLTGIAGSVTLGRGVILAGQVGVADQVHIGDGAVILARGAVMSDVEPKQMLIGEPAMPRRPYLKYLALREKLPDAIRQIGDVATQLEAALVRIAELERRISGGPAGVD